MKTISRAEAQSLGLKRYYTGNPCPKSHDCERFCSTRGCVECAKENRDRSYKKWYSKAKQDPEYKRKTKERRKRYKHKQKEYQQRFIEKHGAEHLSEYKKKWKEENIDRVVEGWRKQYQKDKERIKARAKIFYEEHKNDPDYKAKRKAAIKRWNKRNPCFKFIRRSLRRAMANYGDYELVGYTAAELRNHLQAQFKDGMSWDNYGEWHIDHIKPIKAFIDEGVTDPAIINALDNLQPLWASENLSKGARYNENQANKTTV